MIAPRPIKVFLVDDHMVVRQGLRALLHVHGMEVIGEAGTGREAVQMSPPLRPDVIVMDLEMPVLNGLEATRQIVAANPAARVLALSGHHEDICVVRMVEAGAVGFVDKLAGGEILARAIGEVARGRQYFSPAIVRRLDAERQQRCNREGMPSAGRGRLTRRETEVWQLVAEGAANKQMAATLGISVKTVEKHRQNLMDKLNLHDTAGLTRQAIATGLIGGGLPSALNPAAGEPPTPRTDPAPSTRRSRQNHPPLEQSFA